MKYKMTFQKLAASLFSMVISLLLGQITHAAPVTQTIAAECVTKGTNLDGSRESCESQVTVLRAAENNVFVPNSVTGGEWSGAGSEHQCRIWFGDYVEVIPGSGIDAPTTVYAQSKSRSPKNNHGSRGWAKCKWTLSQSKYQ